jgi:hypothetical protein
MNLSLFRLLTVSLCLLLIAQLTGAAFAQGQYRLEYGYLPPGTTSLSLWNVSQMNDGNMIAVLHFGHFAILPA